MGRCIKEPQLTTGGDALLATGSRPTNCDQPSATGSNKRLKSDWGSGVLKAVDPDGSLLNPVT
jgi:hypothetical protein